jgi:short-subunit dehydrogenase
MDVADRYGPWAVIAGGSDGIGASVARLLGERGVNVVLVARRPDALADVARTVASESRTVTVDLSTLDAADALIDATSDLEVGLLVYNAGADPYMSQFLDQPVEIWQEMVTRNCTTMLRVTHHFAGRMVARGRGGVVIISSGAAWAGGARLAVYGATKAFDLLLAESLWAELGSSGVDVLGMVLGTTDTPAFRRLVGGRLPPGVADPDDVARDLLDQLADGPTFPPDASPLGAVPRRRAVELISQAAAALHEQ